jgi:hypothetical protein
MQSSEMYQPERQRQYCFSSIILVFKTHHIFTLVREVNYLEALPSMLPSEIHNSRSIPQGCQALQW